MRIQHKLFCIFACLAVFASALSEKQLKGDYYFLDRIPELMDTEEEMLVTTVAADGKTRLLATQTTYPQIRIAVDYSNLDDGTTEFKNYIKNNLVPLVISYFQSALKIKQPLTSNLKLSSTTKTVCGYPVPTGLSTGTATDFFIIVSSTTVDSNWVASAGSCALSSTTKRPTIAQLIFNTQYTSAAGATDPLIHEKNMFLTMHELLHALGFAGSSFVNFIDASGNTLTGHVKTVTLNGSERTVLDVEPLTTRLRNHFGCSTLPGAFMENDGGTGTAGSHFERRHFLYETMTSGVMQGLRLSQFSLAVMEGSGWYVPDYSYADPYYFGQGEGCSFLYDSCSNTGFSFPEFCSTAGRSCTALGVGGGICAKDTRSDDCFYYVPVLDYACENPDAVDNARFPTFEAYGRDTGSRCFTGTLSKTSASSSATSFCFKYVCSGSGLTTKLQVKIGTATATCTSGAKLKLSGYYGAIDCPDPIEFCKTVGFVYCPRNCMGQGTCVSNKCVCKTGYTGIDCAMKA